MNTYVITIKGMHCNGCKNLITMTLEDAGFSEALVDVANGTATFSAEADREETDRQINKAFQDLPDYQYLGIQ